VSRDPGGRTIQDFGEQWTQYRDNAGFYGSTELFDDVFGPMLRAADLRGLVICDIGAGTGRFVNIAMAAGAAHVHAVEPSDAFEVLRENTRAHGDRVSYLRITGAAIPADLQVDLALSIGVLHHVPDPGAVVRAAWHALKPGGRIAIWVYGRENNGVYLALLRLLRTATTRLPHPLLAAGVRAIDLPLSGYMTLCRRMPLPLRGYLVKVLGRMTPEKRRLVIYDQLNPAIAQYYRRQEVERLLLSAGFVDVKLYHRHGYSWAALGSKAREGL
jgi:SAM-dependent methyltransferase